MNFWADKAFPDRGPYPLNVFIDFFTGQLAPNWLQAGAGARYYKRGPPHGCIPFAELSETTLPFPWREWSTSPQLLK
ncbi:hypothetical protein A4R26_18710 [Niastella populi]|uniref:Uncharacterized protein n=1 Tax=Niastella populi TaxID=550983 RepID=A0A1V9FTE2_9BACT|nr:hypothetical protein A4R26_18710 [Niastella populi]